MRILVVEDDPNLRAHWGGELAGAGHEVEQIDNEPEALARLQVARFDLVILDLCMNGRNALGVATLATYRNGACKVIVVSGSSVFSRPRLFAMSPAVSAALHKPVDIETLLAACEELAPSAGQARPQSRPLPDAVAFRT